MKTFINKSRQTYCTRSYVCIVFIFDKTNDSILLSYLLVKTSLTESLTESFLPLRHKADEVLSAGIWTAGRVVLAVANFVQAITQKQCMVASQL